MNVTMRYCEGWDWAFGEAVGWLTGADAFAADCAGRPYTVLVAPAEGTPVVIDIAGEDDYLAVSRMDGEKRRTGRTVYRRLRAGRLFPVRDEEWRYAPGESMGDSGVWYEKVEREPGGWTRISTGRGEHGSGVTVTSVVAEALWRPLPGFGEWVALTSFARDAVAAVLEPMGGSELLGWYRLEIPRDLPPPYLDALITPGARVVDWRGNSGEVGLLELGTLKVPSGRIAGADPAGVGDGVKPFEVPVRPGEYRVDLADVDCGTSGAAILWVSERPVVRWEAAVRSDGGLGIPVDAGMGCFVDAENAEALGEAIAADEGVLWNVRSGYNEIWVDGEDANLVAFVCPRGDGSYGVWIGRDADDGVVCFLADLNEVRLPAGVTAG